MNTEENRRGARLALLAAILGWMFDGFEMGLFPLVASPALNELLSGKQEIYDWIAIITATFLVGAATGGVLFGWLGDRIGRVRAMTLSVLTYAIFSGLCGFSESARQLAIFRFIAALGMGGEWALGVALVSELWPGKSRAWLAGLIGAAGNIGYMLNALLSLGLQEVTGELTRFLQMIGFHQETINWLTRNGSWRLLMMAGALPAVLTFLIRIFVPESEKWKTKQAAGETKQWALRDLVGVLFGMCSALLIIYVWSYKSFGKQTLIIVTLFLLTGVLAGYLFPVWQFLGRTIEPVQKKSIIRRMLLAASLSGVALLGTWGTTQNAPTFAHDLSGWNTSLRAKEYTQLCSSFGAAVGCVLAALLGDRLGRRLTYRLLCIASLVTVVFFFRFNSTYSTWLYPTVFLLGLVTASFYGWLPLYLPELFPTSVRATAQGFSFNFGRIIAAIGVLQLPLLLKSFEEGYRVACPILALIYLLGIILISFVPETKGKPLPE